MTNKKIPIKKPQTIILEFLCKHFTSGAQICPFPFFSSCISSLFKHDLSPLYIPKSSSLSSYILKHINTNAELCNSFVSYKNST